MVLERVGEKGVCFSRAGSCAGCWEVDCNDGKRPFEVVRIGNRVTRTWASEALRLEHDGEALMQGGTFSPLPTCFLRSNRSKKYLMAAGWVRWSQASTKSVKAIRSISSLGEQQREE